MVSESLNRSDALSADEVVEALLDEVDVKAFVARIPPPIDEALLALEKRFCREYNRNKFVNADRADDRAVELVGEVCNDFVIDTTGSEFNTLLMRAIRLSRNVRPLFA
jgi:hypothetical protein